MAKLPRYPVPMILLAQLGVDKRFQGQGLGAKVLISALRHAHHIAASPEGVPAVGVILDALDEDALKFYQSFEFFLPFPGNPVRLFIPMESISQL